MVVSLASCSYDRLMMKAQRAKVKTSPLEQVGLQSLVERYMAKDQTSIGTLEGIYSVSSVVTKKGKTIFSSQEREKITDRQENYSKVAIMRDNKQAGREYIEVVIDDKAYQSHYPVYGEFSAMAESNLLLYKHYDSKGRSSSFTFTYDKAKDVLEGIRTDNNGNKTITYKLTYVKISPKAPALQSSAR
jgi:Tfp pilus assembly protein PilE